MDKYKIKKITNSVAQNFWEDSPNQNIFNNPSFLSNFKGIEIYGVFKGEELLCCWPIMKASKKILEIPNFFYYFGPFWGKKIINLPIHSWLPTSKNVYSKFIEYFKSKFSRFHFQMHYSLQDIRIFDWWDHNKKKKYFKVFPRYTACISDLSNMNSNQIKEKYRYVRRYELKKFQQHLGDIEKFDIKKTDLFKYYINFADANYTLSKKKDLNKSLDLIFELVQKGFGEITSIREKKTKKIIYLNLVLFDKKSVHLLINVAQKEWRKKGIITWGVDNLLNRYKSKYSIFDFNGANSPQRGDDKQSYGASEKLFFQIKFN